MSVGMLDFLQYVHLEKLYGHLPGLVSQLPAIFGLSAEQYEASRRSFDEQARQAAADMLADAEVENLVAGLPFQRGHRVLAVGDSITDDLRSWAEILRHLLELRRPEDKITVINAGLSAHTTAMVLRRWPGTLASRPQQVICAMGGNDVTRVGPDATKTQVSVEESMANLHEMRRIARASSDPAWLWVSPAPVIPDRVRTSAAFRFGQSSWDNSDVAALTDALLASTSEPVVDLVRAFGIPARDDLQGHDGVHPTLAGHKVITREVLKALADPASSHAAPSPVATTVTTQTSVTTHPSGPRQGGRQR